MRINFNIEILPNAAAPSTETSSTFSKNVTPQTELSRRVSLIDWGMAAGSALMAILLIVPQASAWFDSLIPASNKILAGSEKSFSKRQEIVNEALSRVGKEFNPGVSAQCAYFVRDVLKDVGVNIPVARHPFDKAVNFNGPYGGRAQSFFSEEIGTMIHDPNQLQPGDLVAFQNTYGNFPTGSITHVGIVVRPGQMVDRSTRSEPVKSRPINTFKFAVGVRINDKFLTNQLSWQPGLWRSRYL